MCEQKVEYAVNVVLLPGSAPRIAWAEPRFGRRDSGALYLDGRNVAMSNSGRRFLHIEEGPR